MDLPPLEELIKKIEELTKKIEYLEASHAQLKQEISNLVTLDGEDETSVGMMKQRRSASPQRLRPLQSSCSFRHVSPIQKEFRCSDGGGGAGRDLFNLENMRCLNILQSMGQAVHILDCNDRIIYWNRMAENLYGYTAAEAIGRNVIELLTDFQDYNTDSKIISRVVQSESWTGVFPVKNKEGKRFQILAIGTPFYDDDDDDRKLIGLICVSADSQPIQKVFDAPLVVNEAEVNSTFHQLKCAAATKLGLDPKQPLQSAITSQLSNLASKNSLKVSNKVRSTITRDSGIVSEGGSGDSNCAVVVPANRGEDVIFGEANTRRGFELNLNSHGKFYRDHDDRKGENYKIESTMMPCHTNGMVNQRTSSLSKQETKAGEIQHPINSNTEASGSALSVFNVNSMNSASRSGSTSSTTVHKLDFGNDCLDCEVLWEDLEIAEQVGQGSSGVVYHALWYGSDVAVKVFSNQDYSEDITLSFRQEISMMKKLRHPNILLFMGAVASPDRLCIVTEFLSRGSLFGMLQRNGPKLDWRRCIQMAIDIARGMSYLHHFNPPIIHRDLKSSNLLVDRNWTLKVGDFGLSRPKHETYLTMRTGRGTTLYFIMQPQWMAPEVLRNQPSDEKSDVYSYGVVLWELVTQKIPWENHNSIQVVSAVGYMDRRLEIPTTVDPQWASIIESCWHSDSRCRPTFQELLDRLKDLQRQHLVRLKSARSGSVKVVQKNANTD